jgi:hypothetical protein
MLCGEPLASFATTTANSSPAMTSAHAGAKTKTALAPTIRGVKSGSHSLASLIDYKWVKEKMKRVKYLCRANCQLGDRCQTCILATKEVLSADVRGF